MLVQKCPLWCSAKDLTQLSAAVCKSYACLLPGQEQARCNGMISADSTSPGPARLIWYKMTDICLYSDTQTSPLGPGT